MKTLDQITIEDRLQKLEGWTYSENAIHTSLEIENFKEAFATMTRIAFEAEVQNHHPDWSNSYNELRNFRFQAMMRVVLLNAILNSRILLKA